MDSECLVCSSSVRLPCESYLDTLSWSERIHQSQGDCLILGYISSLPEEPYTDRTQNRMFDLATLWEQFGISKKRDFVKLMLTSLVTSQIRDVTDQRQTYTYASEALTY